MPNICLHGQILENLFFKGRVINGSHMLDLVKSITAPHTIRDEYRPRGWSEFLDAFAVLNIPFSTVTNPTS